MTGNRPSPWLQHPRDRKPNPHPEAGFVEYLRWMRSLDLDDSYKESTLAKKENNLTKVDILQRAARHPNYSASLEKMTGRTRLLAGQDNCFEVSCPWRIRVGGQKGPESILLPAFDAVGIPYIPSATLRGVARTQAIRAFMKEEGLNWKQAEAKIAPWFGSIDEEGSDRTAKVIFFDAYPLPVSNEDGLDVDIANNIWSWSEQSLTYQSNPNVFLSLYQPTFLVGMRPRTNTQNSIAALRRVRTWLKRGLAAGIGAQVNTGYGVLLAPAESRVKPFLQVPFTLEGQLIHGIHQVSDRSDKDPEDEVRPTAFKSVMRYWFRALAGGVLPVGTTSEIEQYNRDAKTSNGANPPATVKALEALLFGSIAPQTWGWLTVRVTGETVVNSFNRKKRSGRQVGSLSLLFSESMPAEYVSAVQDMCKALVWLMFHLGGVGQGARRPCYSRRRPPFYRGSTVALGILQNVDREGDLHGRYGATITPGDRSSFWITPEEFSEFESLFKERLRLFYSALSRLTGQNISCDRLRPEVGALPHEWTEALNQDCCIFVVEDFTEYSDDRREKPAVLKELHRQFHRLEDSNNLYDAKNLAGHATKDRVPLSRQGNSNRPVRQKPRLATPSPIWISNIYEQFQVVTIFGASQKPRKQFCEYLKSKNLKRPVTQIWPLL